MKYSVLFPSDMIMQFLGLLGMQANDYYNF